jgi:hypothetical protein
MAGAAEQNVDVRKSVASGDRAALMRNTLRTVSMASGRLGPSINPSFDQSGRLRSIARYSPPLSESDNRDADTVGRSFALNHDYLFDIDNAWIRGLELVARDRSGPNVLLRYRQQAYGIRVFQSDLRIHVSPAGEVLELDFWLEQTPFPADPREAGGAVTIESALRCCVDGLEPTPQEPINRMPNPSEGTRHQTKLKVGPGSDEVIAQWIWFPVDRRLRLAWHFDAVPSDSGVYYECIVDAQDGTLLFRNSITFSEITGLVFDTSSPQPSATPGVIPPSPNPPATLSRREVSFAGDPDASPAGWVGPAKETIGNNVTAREDKAGDNETTPGATAKALDDRFSFPLELGSSAPSPANFTEAAVTSLFYWCNVAHDYFYKLGFTEAAGNFQEDNFGRGGLDKDSLRADAQDGIDLSPPLLNNANMSVPGEGSKPRMQMYLFGRSGGPYQDSDFDPEIILHEWAHGVSARLAPTLGGAQGGAIHEGNSDFFALNFLTPASASPDGSFVAGSYSTQDFVHGSRTRPYSTDFAVNDLTYADFGRVRSYPEFHADGEIWVEVLWELRARLIKRLGYEEGRRRVAQLLIDAMKRAPRNPSFVDMRDSMIAADQADQNGEDIGLIWESFARRGLGFMAVGGDGSNARVLPSKDLPSAAAKVRFFDDIVYVGETIRAFVGDSGNSASTINARIDSPAGDSETLTFAISGAIYHALIPTAGGPPVKDDGVLQVGPTDTVRLVYHDADDGAGAARDVSAEAEICPGYNIEVLPGGIPELPEIPLGLQGDNVARSYSLPFGFPFYDRLNTRIWVSTNGMITMYNTPNLSPFNSVADLKSYAAIAPLWCNLRTTGTAVPSEDIYVSFPSRDSIRFRWAAETVKYSGPGTLTDGNPVDVAVTLTQNGDIYFYYGAGNLNLAPTVGLSRGSGAFAQIYSDYSSTDLAVLKSLENAGTLHWRLSQDDTSTAVYPFLRMTDAAYTGYAVVNYTDKPVDVLFTAQRDDGQPFSSTVRPSSLSLIGGAQAALVGQQLFPSLARDFNGWLELKSTENRLAGFFLAGDNAQTYLSGALPAVRLSKDLMFTHTPTRGDLSGTSLYIVNPSTADANLRIRWYDSGGKGTAEATRTLAPRTRLAADVSTFFPSLPADFKGGYLRVTSDVGVAGVLWTEGSGAPYMISPHEPGSTASLYAPQFVSGNVGGIVYSTNIHLLNSTDSRRTVTIRFLGNDGQLIQDKGITNPRVLNIDPGGQLHLGGAGLFGLPDPASGGSVYQGTLVVAADGPGVVGDASFEDALSHRFCTSLSMDTAPDFDQIFAQVAEGQAGSSKPYFTGIALFNPNSSDVKVQVRVFNARGVLTGTAEFPMKSGTRLARTLAELIPGTNQIGGYVRVTCATGPVATFVLYGTSSLDFLVAIPSQAVVP